MSRDDPYVLVSCEVVHKTGRAVLLRVGDGKEVWIPRACLHGGSDNVVEQTEPDLEVQLRIRQWKAEQESIPYERDPSE